MVVVLEKEETSQTFETRTIEEIVETLIDYRGKTPPKTSSGVRLITAKVIKDGRIIEDNYEYIAEDYYDTWMRRGLPKKGDVLITTEAPLGEVARLNLNEKIALAQRVILLRGKELVIDNNYLFYALRAPYSQAELYSRSTGTTVLGIKQSELRRVRIPSPPLETQQKIAAILSAYDELIENNLRRIKLLEDMAQALYREWFVYYRYPGHEQVPLVDSSLGPIPQGWEVKRLDEICTILMGQSPKSEYYNETGAGLPFHQGVTNFGNRFPTDKTYCNAPSARIAHANDILLSVRAPVGRINLSNQTMIIGRGLSAIRHKQEQQRFALYLLKEAFKEEDAMGNGAIFKAITKDDLTSLKVTCPRESLIHDFERKTVPIDSLIKNLTMKTENLRQTRDLLLPRLISGRLDVSNLEVV